MIYTLRLADNAADREMAMRRRDGCVYDVLVIGGGAAGMLAAASAAGSGAVVALLEKNKRPGRKMTIAGGGRCNLSNTAGLQYFIKNVPGNGRFLISALTRFSGKDCVEFFEKIGIKTRVEDMGKVFPATGRSGDVVAALEKHLLGKGVRIICNTSATALIVEDGRCTGALSGEGGKFYGRAVVIATGGASYPQTGSSGDGYRLAGMAGHATVPPRPGLSPLYASGEMKGRLQGLSIENALLTLMCGGKKIASLQGDVIFTHFGISGPAALDLSREVSGREALGMKLLIDFMTEVKEEELEERLQYMARSQPRKSVGNLLKQVVPDRLAAVIAEMLEEGGDIKSGEAGKRVWRRAAGLIKGFPLTITGTGSLAGAMVTVGGVGIKQIDPRTMASRLVRGLYFAGEVIDIDACTGGFNLQSAFSTGWTAGLSAAEFAGFTGPAD